MGTRDEMVERINLTNDNDIDDNNVSAKSEIQRASQWNRWNDGDDKTTLNDIFKLIDDEMNGKQNLVRPPMGSYHVSYEQIECEYQSIDEKIKLNKKQSNALAEKDSFFQQLKNESTAFLNCLSEKVETIEKYIKINLHLRQNRHRILAQNYCLNQLESFQAAFYPN